MYINKHRSHSTHNYWVTNLRTQTEILAWEHRSGSGGGSGD